MEVSITAASDEANMKSTANAVNTESSTANAVNTESTDEACEAKSTVTNPRPGTEQNWIDDFLTAFHSVNRHLRKGGLTEGRQSITRLQWTLLRHVHRLGASTMGDLAEAFGVRPSTVSQMADRLERDGLIRRSPSNNDARIKVVSLTDKGDELFRNLAAVMAKRLMSGMDKLGVEERGQLIELLQRLATSLGDSENA